MQNLNGGGRPKPPASVNIYRGGHPKSPTSVNINRGGHPKPPALVNGCLYIPLLSPTKFL